MKILLSEESIAKVALLMLLSLNIVAGMTTIVNAAAIKDPTVYVTGNGSGSVELTWKSGKSETYSSTYYANFGGLETVTITPSDGSNIDAVQIDGISLVLNDLERHREFSRSASALNVGVKSIISVAFEENEGVDDVDEGPNVEAYPDPNVGLIFAYVEGEGWVYAETIGLQHPDKIGEFWDIQTTATFDPDVTVCLVCNRYDLPEGVDPEDLRLWRTEVVLGDVNLDGIVDGTDVSIIANANPNDYDPALDLNDDGKIDHLDVELASHNVGEESVWEQLESWFVTDNDLVYVYGKTTSLSIFGIHSGRD